MRAKLKAVNINVILGDFFKSQNKGVEIDGTQNSGPEAKINKKYMTLM